MQCALWAGELLSTENWIAESLLPGNPTDARHRPWLQTPLLCVGIYRQSLQASLSPKLASGKLLIIPTEEKQADPDKNVMAEYGGLDIFLLLITATCFPSSFGLSVQCSGSGPISKVLVWDIFSLFFHWFLPYFEALLFPLTQVLLYPKECVEFFLQGINLS